MTNEIYFIGVYEIEEQKDVHLLELGIKTNYQNIDVEEFTQEQDGIHKMNWQTPWDEKFLNEDGTKITGDWMTSPDEKSDFTRFAFFLHNIDFDKPLLTPFGEVEILHPIKIPIRISSIIKYEKPF